VLVRPVSVNKWEDVPHWFDPAEITILNGVSMAHHVISGLVLLLADVCDLSVDYFASQI